MSTPTDPTADFDYRWPTEPLDAGHGWRAAETPGFVTRDMPESDDELARDSRWPAFFPSPICLVTTGEGDTVALEKVVGPSIVNRFPYVAALSFCRRHLSERHHVRSRFCERLEAGGEAVIQFLDQGPELAAAMAAIAQVPDERTNERIARAGLTTRPSDTVSAPALAEAYLAYEVRLVRPGRDFDGRPIFEQAWHDVGSHRVYFLEITAIQLRRDIAEGRAQIAWRALPDWAPGAGRAVPKGVQPPPHLPARYQKGYSPDYRFPAADTVAFEWDEMRGEMAVKRLAPLPEDQVEVDNDRARWPCFFPSSAGMITSWVDGRDEAGANEWDANLMPCGSTVVIGRQPLTIGCAISYSRINERYAPRASLDIIRDHGAFGCGVAYISAAMTEAIRYAGTTSFAVDPGKIAHAGFSLAAGPAAGGLAPRLAELPIHFDCKLVDEVVLGTHVLFLGEVRRIFVRDDLTVDNPMAWCPFGRLTAAGPGR